MAAAGIMKACNPPKNNRFCPQAEVTRGQMAVFLAKAFKLSATGGVHFKDVPRGTAQATAIARVVTAGIARPCGKTGSVPRPTCPAAAWPPTSAAASS